MTAVKMKVGIIGCGWFTQTAHIPALKILESFGIIEISAICSRSAHSIAISKSLIGRDVPHYFNYQDLFHNTALDVVVIALPTQLIPSAIKHALSLGVHVLSEKPCAINAKVSKELLVFYESIDSGAKWAVAENWRFKPTVEKLRHIIESHIYGAIEGIDFTFHGQRWANNQSWREQSEYNFGYILDSGVHFASMLRTLGGEISYVNGSIDYKENSTLAKQLSSELRFDQGFSGNLHISIHETHSIKTNAPLLLIKLEKAMILANLESSLIKIEHKKGSETITIKNDSWVWGGVLPMVIHCMQAFQQKEAPVCSPYEALRDIAVIEANFESHRLAHPISPRQNAIQLRPHPTIEKTWNGLQDFTPEFSVRSTSSKDFGVAIRELAAINRNFRAKGAGNSWPDYFGKGNVSINTSDSKRIISFNANRRRVRAQSGLKLQELSRFLADQGFCLPSLPFLGDATVGGAVSTAMHGTSTKWGTMSDFVTSLNIITPTGRELEINGDSDPELMKAARVSIGTLGIITEVELEVTPMYWARNILIKLKPSDFFVHQDSITSTYDHVWAHWILGANMFAVQCLETSDFPKEGYEPYVKDGLGCWVSGQFSKPRPILNANVMASSQYGIPLSRLSEACKLIEDSDFAKEHNGREIEIKFLPHVDKSYLGPNCDYPAALLNIWWPVERTDVNSIFAPFEKLLKSIKGRPHWGKVHEVPSKSYLNEVYPRWSDFEIIRAKLDPGGVCNIFSKD